MTAQPDIIWNEQCLGIRIGEQVCTYLKKHDAEYQRLQKKILELTEKYPVIETCPLPDKIDTKKHTKVE